MLGIVPALGGMVVPYRRWPKARPVFHDMLRRAERMSAKTALDIGMIDTLADDHASLIAAAVERVHALTDRRFQMVDGPVQIALPVPIEPVAANGQRLSAELIRILESTISEAAGGPHFSA